MKIFENIAQFISYRKTLKGRVGFVPTMGNLHQGHLSLIERSTSECDMTLSSLFINPTQFNNQNDIDNYPRTLKEDINSLEQNGVDVLILPTEQEIYPDDYRYRIHETKQSQVMEGKHRPGHFEGMLTIVLKLLLITKPHKAYFGEKDYQQYALIDGMAKAFFLECDIVPCQTVREPGSSLALSSRNNRLSETQKERARRFAHIFHSGESANNIYQTLQAEGFKVEYIEDVDNRRYGAVFIDEIRLIDNYHIE